MVDSKTTALTALTTFSGDELFYVVEDDDGTPVSRKVTVEDLAAGLAAQSAFASYLTWVRRAHTTLTDKTSFSGTGDEQFGTEEATIDDATLPKFTGVTVFAQASFRITNTTSTGSLLGRVEISLDGGSTWDQGIRNGLKDAGGANAANVRPMTVQHMVTGTVTGDIQSRVTVSCSDGASTQYDLTLGVLDMEVIVAP